MFDGAAASDPMPFATAIGLGLLLMGTGLGVSLVAWRARSGSLNRNWIVGIRTSKTLASDDAWQKAHLASATSLGVAGAGTMVAGIGLLTRPSNGWGLALALLGLAWLLFWVMVGAVRGHRAIDSE